MKVLLLLAACAATSLTAQQQQPPSPPPEKSSVDRGVFHINADGRQIGTERFEIAPSPEGIRATAELSLTADNAARTQETAVLILRRGVEPASYERVQRSPKRGSASLTFGPDKCVAQYKVPDGEPRDMEFFLPKNVTVLDTNFFHHYTFLLRQYDFVRGGVQQMNVLVPQEAMPGMVRVEYTGADQSLRKVVVRTDALEIEVWADDAGRIMRLAVPSAKVEVVREVK